MPETNRKLRVFLCHASQDKPVVRELYKRLLAEGWIDPWLDEERLLPGQDWDIEIEKAVESADAIIVCISSTSVSKEGYVQKEIKFALNLALFKPEDTIFVIPLRLDECSLPRNLRNIQYVDYFPSNRVEWAIKKLINSLRTRFQQINKREIENQARRQAQEKARQKADELALKKAEEETQRKIDELARKKADELVRKELIRRDNEERKNPKLEERDSVARRVSKEPRIRIPLSALVSLVGWIGGVVVLVDYFLQKNIDYGSFFGFGFYLLIGTLYSLKEYRSLKKYPDMIVLGVNSIFLFFFLLVIVWDYLLT